MNKAKLLKLLAATIVGFCGFAIFCTGTETYLALNRDQTVRAAAFEFGYPYPFLVTSQRTSAPQALPPFLHRSGWNFFGNPLQIWNVRNLILDLFLTVIVPMSAAYVYLSYRISFRKSLFRFDMANAMVMFTLLSFALAIGVYCHQQQMSTNRLVEELESTETFYVYSGPYGTASRPNDLLVRLTGKRFLPSNYWVPDSVEIEFPTLLSEGDKFKRLTTIRQLDVIGEFPRTKTTLELFDSMTHLRVLSFQDGFWDVFTDKDSTLMPEDFAHLRFLDQLFGDFPDNIAAELRKILPDTLIEQGYDLADGETIHRVRW